jgi:hypothetical protein
MDAVSLGSPQTLNLYAYCGNDPINHADPAGTSFFGKLFGWIGKAFKWAFRVLAVAVAVVAVMAAAAVGQYLGGILITKGLVAFLFGSSALLATAGWAPGKIGQIAGAIVTAGLSWGSNFRTPSTFPKGGGVGGVSSFLSSFQDDTDNTIKIPTEPAYSSYWEYLKAAFSKENQKRKFKRDLDELWKMAERAGKTGEGLPMVGGLGAVSRLGGAASEMVTVSRWGRPGLQAGDWVMKGGATWWNYLKSGKWQPGFGNEFAPFSSGAPYEVLASSVKWPTGWGIDGWIKGLFGQRRYIP